MSDDLVSIDKPIVHAPISSIPVMIQSINELSIPDINTAKSALAVIRFGYELSDDGIFQYGLTKFKQYCRAKGNKAAVRLDQLIKRIADKEDVESNINSIKNLIE